MSENLHNGNSEDVVSWARELLDEAVQEMMRRGVVTDALVEAKPVWALPYEIMIGRIRDSYAQTSSIWVITGDVPTDYVGMDVASTPREAARHFTLKWQLDAARYKDPAVQKELGAELKDSWDELGEQLARTAEALFSVVEDDKLWQESGPAP